MGITPVGTYVDPDHTSQTGSGYKTAIDDSIRAGKRITDNFAPHAKTIPNMTVIVDPGAVMNGTTLTEKTSQTSAAITAPVTNPRIDRIVGDSSTGVISVVTGTPAGSPAAPAIPAGKFPIAQVLVTVAMTAITDDDITDERLGGGGGGGGVILTGSTSAAPEVTVDLSGFAGFSSYIVHVSDMYCSVGNVTLKGRLRDGSGDIGGTNYTWSANRATSAPATAALGASGASGFTLADGFDDGSGLDFHGKFTVEFGVANGSGACYGIYDGAYINNSGALCSISGGFGLSTVSPPVRGFSITPSSGNLTCVYSVEGIR